MNPNDGGPYHPCEVSWCDGVMTGGIQTGNRSGIHTGASLRDVIAIAAMQGLLASDPRCTEFSEIPRLSYEYADAMLIVRAKENGA